MYGWTEMQVKQYNHQSHSIHLADIKIAKKPYHGFTLDPTGAVPQTLFVALPNKILFPCPCNPLYRSTPPDR